VLALGNGAEVHTQRLEKILFDLPLRSPYRPKIRILLGLVSLFTLKNI
jgi:hypothetical protein